MIAFFCIAATGAAIDLISKAWAFEAIGFPPRPNKTIKLIPKLLELTTSCNRGSAFGIGAEYAAFFTIATACFVPLAVVLFLLSEKRHHLLHVGLALLLGGAAGNLYDRLALGFVRDFIYIHYGSFRWPVFNVADVLLVAGVGVVMLAVLLTGRGTAAKNRQDNTSRPS